MRLPGLYCFPEKLEKAMGDAALTESTHSVKDERSLQLASDVMWRFEGKTGYRLWLRLLRYDSRSSSLGFSIITLTLAGRRVFHHRLQPFLSWFFSLPLPSLRGKSFGSQADHYKKSSPSPECLMVRQKSPDDPVFFPFMWSPHQIWALQMFQERWPQS